MNSKILNHNLLFTRVDFDRENKPRLVFSDERTSEFYYFKPKIGENITLKISTKQRFCTGWHNLATSESFTCPDKSMTESKFDQCQKCQKRTGFNPAFYNVSESEVSEQQQIRNSQPHIVYLAHFSSGMIKVGISYAGRGLARLLEQGARSALILGEFPSANVARSYESRISGMNDFCENVRSSVKQKMLKKPYSSDSAKKELIEARARVEERLGVKFDTNEVIAFDNFYANDNVPSGEMISVCDINSCDKIIFSGELRAQVGYILIAEQQGELLTIPAKNYTGFMAELTSELAIISLPERQASLFDF